MVAFEPNLIAGKLKPDIPPEEEEEEIGEDEPSLDPRRIAGSEKGNDDDEDEAEAMEGEDDEADAAKLA